MRRLMWFTIGYALACALGTWVLRGNGILIPAALGLILALAAYRFRKNPIVRRAAAVLLGMAVGSGCFFGYEQMVLRPAGSVDGEIASVEIRVTDDSWDTKYGSAADGLLELNGREYKVRFYLNEQQDLSPGDTVRMEARLRLTDEGGEQEPTYHRTSGILLLGYQRGEVELIRGQQEYSDWPALWRRELKEIISQVFPEDTFAFAKGLLLGDTTDFSHADTTAFSVSGISHIVAVSGLHMSILFAVICLLTGKRRFLTAMIGIPVLLAFAAMVGFTASVTRAVIMQVIMLLALALNREYDPPTALAAACLVMLGSCPLTIAGIGFQLSVASVAGIFLFYGPLSEAMKRRFPGKGKNFGAKLQRWFVSSVCVTLSATVLTVGLCAIHFHTVSLIGVVTNLLVLPVISFLFYGIMIVCAVSFLHWGTAAFLAKLLSIPIRYVLAVARLLSKVPLAAVYTESGYIVCWLVFLHALLLWLLLCRRKRWKLTVISAIVSLCVSLMLSFVEPLVSEYRLTVLDVGQGQCILFQSEGSTFLVDCGGSYDADAGDLAARTLLSQGISRIDGLILTHYDRDHIGGISYLAERISIDRIYLPGTEDSDGLLPTVLDAAGDAEQIPVSGPMTLTIGKTSVSLFPAEYAGSGNDSCVSVLFQREKCDTLITGDLSAAAERQLIEGYELPDLEVLIVGHHGSKYSTCAELLEATAPDVAIISVGANNSYGHPTQEVLDRLEAAGCQVYRTDLHGTILYRG